MDAGERITSAEERIIALEAKVERLLSELAEIRQTSGRIKNITITDKGKGKDK